MAHEARLLYDVESQLFAKAKVFEVLPQCEGIEHRKEIVEQVPGWDVDKGH